jgi:hypothetical protein
MVSLLVAAALLVTRGGTAGAVEYTPSVYQSSSALPGWPTVAAVDGNAMTVWSTTTFATAGHPEWFAFWHAFVDVNFVRITPRFFGRALGFPVTFSIYWSDGSAWQFARTVTNMPTPFRNDDIILALPATVRCNGIQISASVLGTDDVGNYVFQMAEVRDGYDPGFEAFGWVGNDGSANRAQVRNVGSRAFSPTKLRNWNYDARNPIIVPKPGTGGRNVYAPNIVFNGAWNVYFGGWDDGTFNDELSVTVSYDNFLTFQPHTKIMTHGGFTHVNNETVIKTGPNQWQMAYTTYPAGGLNKPGYATSTDGVAWVPNTGTTAALMTMSGYPTWSAADVNGGNAIIFDGSQYHMYWIDFANNFAMSYATSPNNRDYAFQGTKFTGYVPQDIKSFLVGATRYYVSVYHNNGANTYLSLNTSLASPAVPSLLFPHTGTADSFITSIGLVTDGTRLYGALYGASAVPSLDQNRIFASWLQRKVVFQNASTFLGANQSYGPDMLFVYMTPGQSVETGRFSVYDSDGTTLVAQTPKVTLLAGDIWTARF